MVPELSPVFRTLFFLILGTICSAVNGWCVNRIPVPPWMETVLVAEKMVINGLPSEVHRFSANKSAREVVAFYRQSWQRNERGETPGCSIVTSDPWVVVTRLERRRYLLTVQVRSIDHFSVIGYLSVADLKRPDDAIKTNNVPMPGGSKIISDVVSYDPGRKGRTIMLTNDRSVQENSSFYMKHYTGRNWSVLMDQQQAKGHVLFFQRRNNEAKVVVSRASGTTHVVINTVDGN